MTNRSDSALWVRFDRGRCPSILLVKLELWRRPLSFYREPRRETGWGRRMERERAERLVERFRVDDRYAR